MKKRLIWSLITLSAFAVSCYALFSGRVSEMDLFANTPILPIIFITLYMAGIAAIINLLVRKGFLKILSITVPSIIATGVISNFICLAYLQDWGAIPFVFLLLSFVTSAIITIYHRQR